MKREEIVQLLSCYDIGRIQYIGEISEGNSSFASRVDTDRGSYILRRVHGIRNAYNEYAIGEALWGTGISPAIILTEDENPYTVGEHVYNLQERMNGQPITQITAELAYEMGKTVIRMRNILADAQLKFPHIADRFSLHEKLSEEYFYTLHTFKGAWDLFGQLHELTEMDYDSSVPVHGDLGIWNLLEEHGKIHIIDFGEAHMGSPYFDAGALLFSVIDSVKEAEQKQIFDAYLDGCRSESDIDLSELGKAVHLWTLRGLCAALDFPQPDPLIEELLRTCARADTLFEM